MSQLDTAESLSKTLTETGLKTAESGKATEFDNKDLTAEDEIDFLFKSGS
jgi:hypothetical protein